jgi:hypothetical protein
MMAPDRLARLAACVVCVALLAFSACTPAGTASPTPAPPTPAPIRAVYLVMGQAVLTPSDVQAHPEILVVHSFDELAAHAQNKVAIWIDKSATPFDHHSWLNEAPQAWYPLVLVGYHDTLYSFREMLWLCCFAGPIVDWSTVRLEPGFSVIQRQDTVGQLPQATFLQAHDQAPTAGDILAITDALLDGRLKATPAPYVPPGSSPTPPPMAATEGVPTSTPFVPPELTPQVELDAFSGRPNPSWPLSAADTETFRHRVATLSPAAAQTYPGRLGYRGLIVSLPEASGFAVIWTVWDGVAQMTNGATTAYYADPDHALQSWLLQSGQPYLPADLIATVQADISGTPSP